MRTIVSALLVLYGSVLLITPINSFPQTGHKTIRNGINLSMSSFSIEDYGPTMSRGSPNVVTRIDTELNDGPKKNPKVRPSCAGAGGTYCLKSDAYPTDYINSLYAKGVLKIQGFEDTVDYNLTQRVDATNEIPICANRERVVAPTEGETESGDWFFIVNTDNIKQGVRVEECINAGTKCSLLSDAVETKCEQKYIMRKMVGLDGGITKEMKFKIPSCCMCTVLNSGRPKRKLPPPRKSRQVHPMPTAAKSSALSPVDSDTILFPQRIPSLGTKGSFLPQAACAGSTYCEKIQNYPKDHVKMLLKMDALKEFSIYKNEIEPSIVLKNRFEDSGSSLCDFNVRTVHPEAAKTKDNDWAYIVQFGGEESYKQAVQLEICKSEGSKCNYADEFPKGYTTTCKQKYAYRELLSISGEGDPKLKQFQLPSCCACHVASSTSVKSVFGILETKPMTPVKNSKK